jgi:hypothetical protein
MTQDTVEFDAYRIQAALHRPQKYQIVISKPRHALPSLRLHVQHLAGHSPLAASY